MSTTPPVVAYLRSLGAVRDRSAQVYDLALEGKLDHWTWNEKKLPQVVDFCAKLIEVSFLSAFHTVRTADPLYSETSERNMPR
jgi:hypothetical protein